MDKIFGMASVNIHAENLRLAIMPWSCKETLLTHKPVQNGPKQRAWTRQQQDLWGLCRISGSGFEALERTEMLLNSEPLSPLMPQVVLLLHCYRCMVEAEPGLIELGSCVCGWSAASRNINQRCVWYHFAYCEGMWKGKMFSKEQNRTVVRYLVRREEKKNC